MLHFRIPIVCSGWKLSNLRRFETKLKRREIASHEFCQVKDLSQISSSDSFLGFLCLSLCHHCPSLGLLFCPLVCREGRHCFGVLGLWVSHHRSRAHEARDKVRPRASTMEEEQSVIPLPNPVAKRSYHMAYQNCYDLQKTCLSRHNV